MLPFDDKRKQAAVACSDDMGSMAKTSAMKRMIGAIKSGDESEAVDALSDLLELMQS